MKMDSSRIKSEPKISPMWDNAYGVTQRVVDIINQCRYLASKRGMNLKELRMSIREDEAKQRQLVRSAIFSPWFAHFNNHGMIYSQYNVQNYGHPSSKLIDADKWSFLPKTECIVDCNSRSREYHNERSERKNIALERKEKRETDFPFEDNLFNKGSIRRNVHTTSSTSLKTDLSSDSLVNLLYSANLNNKSNNKGESHVNMKPRSLQEYHLDTSSSEMINNAEFFKSKLKSEAARNGLSLDCFNSVSKCNLPARKLASHNLASLCAAEITGDTRVDDASNIALQQPNASLKIEISDSELDFSEIQVIEDLDPDKTVVSPLIQKAESAFADLQKNDALFGTLDDFGHLMSQATKVL